MANRPFNAYCPTTARRFLPRRRHLRGRGALVPLLDVILLLAGGLLLQADFVVQPGVRVLLPAAPFADGAPYGDRVLTLAQEGLVFFNDQRVPLEGLAEVFAQAVHENPDRPLIIEADARVEHGTLVQVYGLALEAGMREVVLATRLVPVPGLAP